MLVRLFSTIVIMSMALSVSAESVTSESTVPSQADGDEARAQSQTSVLVGKEVLERRRAELADKLKVEQVLLKGTGDKGVEIEITYRIVDVEGYAAHPKTTFIADEASSTLIPLTKLHMLFKPMPADEAMKIPPATLTLWDAKGVIKPGQPVTVVVAGYGQKHLIPVAGPDYNQKAAGIVKTARGNLAAAADARLTVHEIRTVAAGHMLKVSYSSEGINKLNTAADQTYIENTETGEKHPLVKVPRIGVLAPKDIGGMKTSYLVIDNAGEKIKPGQQVDVIVSGVRAENITVVEEVRQ